MSKVMTIFGTRPEAIKMAPVVRALRESDHDPVVVVTAQHREMLDQVMSLFHITADHDLDVHRPGQDLTSLTSRVLKGLAPVLASEQPDAVLVQGDTTTTMAGALAAFYAGVPVLHLEAGLRTEDPRNPFPEEMNRRLTTRIAARHLAATPWAKANLVAEGVAADQVVVTGNTVIDALLWTVEQAHPVTDPLLRAAEDHPGRVVLFTCHRRESWGQPMTQMAEAVARLARRFPDVLLVLPLHRNPLVREAVMPTVSDIPNVLVGEPSDYWSFARLMRRADILLTDSGGVQEEGPSLGKPVLVMRDNTERPEAVTAGVAKLVGTACRAIEDAVAELLEDADAYRAMAQASNPYGDGQAARRTVAALDTFLRGSGAVPEFDPASGITRADEPGSERAVA